MNEAESSKKEASQGIFASKKVKAVPEDAFASNLDTVFSAMFQVDYVQVARTSLLNVQKELATKEFDQWLKSELENTELGERLYTQEKTLLTEDKKAPKSPGPKIKVTSWRTFGMTNKWSKILLKTWVADHQVVKNLSEPSGSFEHLRRLPSKK